MSVGTQITAKPKVIYPAPANRGREAAANMQSTLFVMRSVKSTLKVKRPIPASEASSGMGVGLVWKQNGPINSHLKCTCDANFQTARVYFTMRP